MPDPDGGGGLRTIEYQARLVPQQRQLAHLQEIREGRLNEGEPEDAMMRNERKGHQKYVNM
jgi:hypothetical protein